MKVKLTLSAVSGCDLDGSSDSAVVRRQFKSSLMIEWENSDSLGEILRSIKAV